jgi:DnaK suppressor protein
LRPKYRIEQIPPHNCLPYIAVMVDSTLERVLEARRQEMLRDLRQRVHDAREEWKWTQEVRDIADSSELDGREGIELGLIRIKVDTLQRINEALSRLHHGTYGSCVDCRRRISELRLRALPFAVRCKQCEEARECADASDRAVAARERISASAGMLADA